MALAKDWPRRTYEKLQGYENADGDLTAVVETPSATQISPIVGPAGETLYGHKVDEVAAHFQYNQLNYRFDLRLPVTSGSGSVTAENHFLNVISTQGSPTFDSAIISFDSTGFTWDAQADSDALQQSRRVVHFRPGRSIYIDFSVKFTGDTGIGRAGAIDGDNGYFLEREGTQLYMVRRRGGVDTRTLADVTGIDPTKLNVFRIMCGDFGSSNPILMHKSGDFRVIATENMDGTLTETAVTNPSFPLGAQAINGQTVSVEWWSAGVIANGGGILERSFVWPNQLLVSGAAAEQGEMTLNGTNVGTVAIFRSKETFNGLTNKVPISLTSLSALLANYPASGDGEVIVQFIGNPTFDGTPSYADVAVGDSTVEYDHTNGTGASVNVTGGVVLWQGVISYDSGFFSGTTTTSITEAEVRDIGNSASAGDVFAVIAKDTGAEDVTVHIELGWIEGF